MAQFAVEHPMSWSHNPEAQVQPPLRQQRTALPEHKAVPPAHQAPLRERKKLRTRQQLVDAALDLFERQGFAETPVEEIVAAVGVSRRTFSRYFGVKEDVVVSVEAARYEETIDALARRPPDEPVMLALRNSILRVIDDHGDEGPHRERFMRVQRLLATTPALLAHSHERQAAAEDKAAAILSRRIDVDIDADMTPRLAVALAHRAARVAMDTCQRAKSGVAPEEYARAIRQVFTAMGEEIDFGSAADRASEDAGK